MPNALEVQGLSVTLGRTPVFRELSFAVALAVASVLGGFYGAPLLHVETGPFTIAIAAAFFFLSLVRCRVA